MRQLFLLLLCSGGIWGVSCKKSNISGLYSDGAVAPPEARSINTFKDKIDAYILDSFINPFNVRVRYTFDDLDNGSGNVGVDLVPPREEVIIPLLRAIHRAWITPYLKVQDSNFLRRFIPKEIRLVGSKRWQSDGTVVLGVAEGGKRILLFDVNSYSISGNLNGFLRMIHTIQHEFAHILHQTILFDKAFRSISLPGHYTAAWFNVKAPENYLKGFVTSYAMSAAEEDFVETLSNAIVYKKTATDTSFFRHLGIVTKAENGSVVTPKTDLKYHGFNLWTKKYTLVRDYLASIWDIKIDVLEKEVQAALEDIKKNPTLYDAPKRP